MTVNGGVGGVFEGVFSASRQQTGIYWVEIRGLVMAVVNANGNYLATAFNQGPNGFNVKVINHNGALTSGEFTFMAFKF